MCFDQGEALKMSQAVSLQRPRHLLILIMLPYASHQGLSLLVSKSPACFIQGKDGELGVSVWCGLTAMMRAVFVQRLDANRRCTRARVGVIMQ